MKLDVQLSCPLGHKCEEARDGVLHRCAWFTLMQGTNPQTGESVDEWGCAMTWLPVLLVENARTARGTSAAIESFRNEVKTDNQLLAAAALTAMRPPDAKLIEG
jgi:hypothetical protein